MSTDSLALRKTTFVNATTSSKMKEEEETKLLEWLKIRLNTDDVALPITTEQAAAPRPVQARRPRPPETAVCCSTVGLRCCL